MARVKRAVNAQKKRRVILERASGYRGQRSRLYRKAKEQVTHSLVYAYRDRRKRKGDFRRLWIQRINAAARQNGITYNRFMQGLGLAGVQVDRRMLAELAVTDAAAFASLVEPFRRELQLHCYRLLGSVQDAEDLVQETLLAAWRGLNGFEERASLRSWLYRIATNRSLNAIRERGRRPATENTMRPPRTRRAVTEGKSTGRNPYRGLAIAMQGS